LDGAAVECVDVPGVARTVVLMMNWLRGLTESPRLLVWLGVFVFGYSWFASLCLQLWVIPSLFSQPGAAEGLVVLDSIGFDRIAKEQAAEIARLGWSAWELRPHGQSPAGIASVFYALFGPSPSSMLPFNAMVHAVSACAVMAILRNFFSVMPALIGALVFALNPASFEWVAQIHRDGVFILGNLLLILGVLSFIRQPEPANEYREVWYWPTWLLIPVAGTMLIWVARLYWLQVALATLMLVAIVVMLTTLLNKVIVGHRMVLFAGMIFLVGIFQLWLIRFHTAYEPIDLPASQAANQAASQAANQAANQAASQAANQAANQAASQAASQAQFVWWRSSWLPEAIEGRLYRMAQMRRGAIRAGGNSLVDAHWRVDSAGAIIGYIPRAFQLGLFSPFPDLWGGEGSTPAMTMARKVVGGVTLLFYVCLAGLVIGLWRMRRNLLLWVMIGACLTGILVYAIIYPNVGTLIRFRYGFYMLLIGFGTAWWCDLWLRRSNYIMRE
jgi:hypothetical protein